jgi:hypothetical protein
MLIVDADPSFHKCPFAAGDPSEIKVVRTAGMPLRSKFDNTQYLDSIKLKNTDNNTMVVGVK